MKNYLIGLVITLGISGCVSIPSIDFSQQKVERFNPVKNWISVDTAPVISGSCCSHEWRGTARNLRNRRNTLITRLNSGFFIA